MTTLDFNKPLFDLEGNAVPGKMLSATMSEIIGMETEGKTLKLYGWHKTLQVGDPLIIDDSDKADLEKLVENHKQVFTYIKGQLLDIINPKN